MNPPRERFVELPDVRLHLVEAGAPDGPPVLLLHGFPEHWSCWRHQLAPLAAAGYRLLVPDQRGYNLSGKPRGVRAYGLDTLVDDVVALLDALSIERLPIVGHDWGAAVAWWLAARNPERLTRLAILDCPHPLVMRRHLLRNPVQRRRSWYIFLFQLPWLPERKLRRHGYRAIRSIFAKTSRPGTFSDEDLDRYVAAAAQPGALTAMLNWYRAAFRCPPRRLASPRIEAPTILLWGARDMALGRELVAPSAALCREVAVTVFEEAGHWLPHEEPARVNELLLAHLGGGTSSG